jgi:hypothetical protein
LTEVTPPSAGEEHGDRQLALTVARVREYAGILLIAGDAFALAYLKALAWVEQSMRVAIPERS